MYLNNGEGTFLAMASTLGVHEVSAMGGVKQSEDRWSQRRPALLPVELVSHGLTWAVSQTRDVSLGGVFVEIADKKPTVGNDVELYFVFNDFGNSIRYRLNARVVRHADDGIGLSFKDFDTQSFRTLQEVMRHVPLPAGI